MIRKYHLLFLIAALLLMALVATLLPARADAGVRIRAQLKTPHLQAFVDRFKAKATKARQAQSRVKMLEKMTPITPPAEAARHVFTFPAPEELSPPIIARTNW